MGRAKSMSSTTLISEVVSLVGLPRKCTPRLSKRKLAPCAIVEDGYDSSETLAEYGISSYSQYVANNPLTFIILIF